MFNIKPLYLSMMLSVISASPALSDQAPLPQASLPQASLPQAAPTPNLIAKPVIIPTPPMLNARAYILIDADSGKIIAEKNSTERLPPASLTKMMTLYVISNALHHEQMHLTDRVHVSEDAWHAEGSRMFIKEGDEVAIEDLIKGIIVDSGNDACVAMAEHIGGSEPGFAQIMNQQAQNLGMKDSHFTDSNGLPNADHYTTARDLAILGRALVNNFPEYYPWYQQKWFTYNGIRQPNRNRLLWRNGQVDGIKTGHTNEAGFCLVASAKRDRMRLISVILGAPNDKTRADDSEKLLNYGFRFYETHALYQAKQPIQTLSVYKGRNAEIPVGSIEPIYLTVPAGQYDKIKITTQLSHALEAPIALHQPVGQLIVEFDHKPIETRPLYALQAVERGGIFKRMKDSCRLSIKRWIG